MWDFETHALECLILDTFQDAGDPFDYYVKVKGLNRMAKLNRSSSSEHLLQNSESGGYGTATTKGYHVSVHVDPRKEKTGPSDPYSVNVGLERQLSMDVKGSTVTAHDLNYTVDAKSGACSCCGSKKKHILQNINGIFRPGMNAILGPTGSGKSSLLDILAGRKEPRGLAGHILIDGATPPDNFKCMVGYVVQDDVVMGTLSVRENFHFSASLRLPKGVSHEEKKKRVELVINELGLKNCAETRVGTEFIRGVSGGERKRTNIGMELIISPRILFLDEPTTGLDASTANAVMLLLRRLALRGRTVVFSIHQPRFTIYRLFDSLTLLSLGEMVYHGAASQALEYFSSAGYDCEQHNNPPDFFLDVINGDSTAVSATVDDILKKDCGERVHDRLVTQFKLSLWNQRLENEIKPIFDEFLLRQKNNTEIRMPRIKYTTSMLRQLLVVSGRAIKNLYRNPQTSVMQLGTMMFFALIVGLIYLQIDDSCKNGIQNRTGVFFFIIMNQIFGNLSAVEIFIKERKIFMHENVSGFYRVSAYFLAKIFCDVIPMRLIPVLVFSAITYFMIGLETDVGKFFIFTLTLFCVSVAASSVAFFWSSSVQVLAIANLCIALSFVFMMIFSGLLVNLDSVVEWLAWIKWLSIFRYGINALSINEMKDMTFHRYDNKTQNCPTGNQYLDLQGISYETEWDLWVNVVALVGISLVSMTGAYIQLRRMKKLA
ncbi:hypothetical protein ScPMuIL_003639 [Solemya velum]